MTGSTLKDALRADLTTAMRARDKVRAGTLRMVLTAVATEEVAGDSARVLSDDEVLQVVTREAKKRREAAGAYAAAGRPELVATEEAELAVLEAYLPRQLTDDELDGLVQQAVGEVGATGMAQMGQVMKVVQPRVAGRADGRRVAAAVRAALVLGDGPGGP